MVAAPRRNRDGVTPVADRNAFPKAEVDWVTVLEAGERILPREDADVVQAVEQILAAVGVTVVTGARVTRVDSTEDAAIVHYEAAGPGGTAGSVEADVVLAAVGRAQRTAGLRLEAAGVRTTTDRVACPTRCS